MSDTIVRMSLIRATACAFLFVANIALAKSDRDQDTSDRHDRASASSSDSNGGNDTRTAVGPEPWSSDCCAGELDGSGSGTPAAPLRAASGELELRPKLVLDHPGAAFALDIAIPYFVVTSEHRSGLTWHLDVGYARWLDDERPEGAAYSSTLDLLRINAGFAYRYTWLTERAEISIALGPTFMLLRALESFSDGASLNETLFSGIAIGPSMRVDLGVGLGGGHFFLEGGVNVATGRVTPYLDQYDSLLAGLDSLLVVPHARIGHLWELAPGAELGLAYDAQAITGDTWTETLICALRFSTYVVDDDK